MFWLSLRVFDNKKTVVVLTFSIRELQIKCEYNEMSQFTQIQVKMEIRKVG